MQKPNKPIQSLNSASSTILDKSSSPSSPERFLPLPEVESQSGFKSSFIYQLIKEGKFPKPVKIGNASRWRESEIQQWIQDQIKGDTPPKRAGVRA